jgi:hypothetical protein
MKDILEIFWYWAEVSTHLKTEGVNLPPKGLKKYPCSGLLNRGDPNPSVIIGSRMVWKVVTSPLPAPRYTPFPDPSPTPHLYEILQVQLR